jgi:dTDP-4-dehydrorhamnose 3,5-epimerase
MNITAVDQLAIPEIKVIHFARFCDQRGYFTEHYRQSDFEMSPLTSFMRDVSFVQMNESFSRATTIRGLHFQWNPYMGKLVRTLHGHMIDLVLDIRLESPTFGKAIAYDMPAHHAQDAGAWIWVPPGFAHGNMFLEDTSIEYLCSGEYSPGCEAGISPLADDIDWSLCDPTLRETFDQMARETILITDKDRHGLSVNDWSHDERSRNFVLETSMSSVERSNSE